MMNPSNKVNIVGVFDIKSTVLHLIWGARQELDHLIDRILIIVSDIV